MEKLDQFLNIFESGLSVVVTLGCIFLVGLLVFNILPFFGFTGLSHYLLTGILALIGAGVVKMVISIAAWFS